MDITNLLVQVKITEIIKLQIASCYEFMTIVEYEKFYES